MSKDSIAPIGIISLSGSVEVTDQEIVGGHMPTKRLLEICDSFAPGYSTTLLRHLDGKVPALLTADWSAQDQALVLR